MDGSEDALASARLELVTQWGVLGSAWGISRTMAMVHALLLTSPTPLSTDEVMEALAVSRGNANTNLRELVSWGLLRRTLRPGERRDFFEAEKDVWKIFCTVARERKRREIDPVLAALASCLELTKGLRGAKAKAFHAQLASVHEFVTTAGALLDRIAASEQSKVMPVLIKWLA